MKLVPKPRNTDDPVTLLSLYRQYTGDHAATEDQIRACLTGETLPRRRIVSYALKGYSHRQIAIALKISHGSVTKKLERSMRAAHKRINNLPRYTRGRKGASTDEATTPEFDLAVFRKRYPGLQPNARVMHNGQEREAISYPWPHGTGALINLRTPGDPTTMYEADADEVTRLAGPLGDQAEFVKRIRTQADWIEAWDAAFFDPLTASDLDTAVRQFTAHIERALRDVRRRNQATE